MRDAVEGSQREPSSEAEAAPRSEGSVDGPHCVRGPRVGFPWVLYFLPDLKEAVGLRGPSCLTCVRVFQGDLSIPIRVSLIVVPDSSPRGFGRVKGFGQRVFQRFPPMTRSIGAALPPGAPVCLPDGCDDSSVWAGRQRRGASRRAPFCFILGTRCIRVLSGPGR